MESCGGSVLSRNHEEAGPRLWPTHLGGLKYTGFDGVPGFPKQRLGDIDDLALIMDNGGHIFDDHDRNI